MLNINTYYFLCSFICELVYNLIFSPCVSTQSKHPLLDSGFKMSPNSRTNGLIHQAILPQDNSLWRTCNLKSKQPADVCCLQNIDMFDYTYLICSLLLELLSLLETCHQLSFFICIYFDVSPTEELRVAQLILSDVF